MANCAGAKWAWLTSGDLWVRGREPGGAVAGAERPAFTQGRAQLPARPQFFTCGCVMSPSHVCTRNARFPVGIGAVKRGSGVNESWTREGFPKGRDETARGSSPGLGQVKTRPVHARPVEGPTTAAFGV